MEKVFILDCINYAAAAIAEIKQHTLNTCWKVVWSECVFNRNVTKNISMLSSEIVVLAYNIYREGFNTFSENDIIKMIHDKKVIDNDIINYITDPADGQEECAFYDSR